MADSPKCYSYKRFSRPEQSMGNSFVRQDDMARKYAIGHNLILDEELCIQDEGISAFKGKNLDEGAALGSFLKLVKANRVPANSVLIIEALDRLSRQDILPSLALFTDIINHGIKIVTVMDNKEYSRESITENPYELISSISMFVLANAESKHKSIRLSKAWDSKRENILTKKLTSRCPAWLKLDDNKKAFSVIEGRDLLVQRIFKMAIDGIGNKTIAKILNVEGIKAWETRKRKTIGWQPSYISKILQNRSVLGEFQPHKYIFDNNCRKRVQNGDIIKDYFPQIVDDEIFGAVQTHKKSVTHKGGKTGKISNLFGGIAFCGYCGASMQYVTKSKSEKYLICDNARRGVKCKYSGYRYQEIERAFLEYCSKDIDILDVIANANNNSQTELERLRTTKLSLVHDLEKKKHNLELQKQNITTASEIGIINVLTEILTNTITEIENINLQIDVINKNIELLEANRVYADNFVDELNTLITSITDSMKEDDIINIRHKIRHSIRNVITRINIFPIGNYFSQDVINNKIKEYDVEADTLPPLIRNHQITERDNYISYLQRFSEGSRDSRYFEIVFSNNNYRTIKYSPIKKGYIVTKERVDSKLSYLPYKSDNLITISFD